jgi:hypothetical protein
MSDSCTFRPLRILAGCAALAFLLAWVNPAVAQTTPATPPAGYELNDDHFHLTNYREIPEGKRQTDLRRRPPPRASAGKGQHKSPAGGAGTDAFVGCESMRCEHGGVIADPPHRIE